MVVLLRNSTVSRHAALERGEREKVTLIICGIGFDYL